MPLAAGVRLGSYEIIAPLGAGGMGEVYRARDTRLDREVALKVLPAELGERPAALARFEREAKAVAALSHPNILSIFDFGTEQGTAYAVAELLQGETLRSRLAAGALPLRKALDWAQQIAQGLAAAHEKGVVHRDLKPENVFVTHDGRLKILDFGLARREATAPSADDSPTLEQHTEPGTVLGTVGYMSPEQARGEAADARSDIFSFGAVLYEMLTGRRPFRGTSSVETLSAILKDDPPSPSSLRPDLPSGLERIVLHCLEKSAADRFQSVRDLAFDLASVPGSAAVSSRPRRAPLSRFAALGLFGLVVAGIGAGWLWPRLSGNIGPRVVVLMDSPHPERVYDDATRKAGGTNADDLTDVLRDLPVLLVKENTNATWRREDEVLRQRPELVVVHRSCFYDATFLGNPELGPPIQPLAWDKLEAFIGYVGLGHPRTRFLVYSRRSWRDEAEAAQWVASLEKRFSALHGRVQAWRVPLDHPTFRHPQTGAEIRREIERLLGLAPAPSAESAARR